MPDDWTLTLVDTETGERVDMRQMGEHRFSVAAASDGNGGGVLNGSDGPAPSIAGGPSRLSGDLAARFRLDIGTRVVGTEAAAPETFSFSAPYPNPTRGTATFRVNSAVASQATIRVFDVLGREVLVSSDVAFTAGPNQVELDLSGLHVGLYTVRVASGQTSSVFRVAVVR